MVLNFVAMGVRALQFLFATVVLGLAATLQKQQKYGDSPTTTRFSIFTGGFGMIIAAIGLVTLFIERIPGLVPMALDALAGILLLAGGIAWAVGLKGVSCTARSDSNSQALYANGLLNEGCTGNDNPPYCGVWDGHEKDPQAVEDLLYSNCQKAFADEIFQFITFAFCAALIALGWVIMRRGGGSARGTRGRYV